MSTVSIASATQFRDILNSSAIVVADFYADWCGPCKTIAPHYESLASKYSKPKRITFTKVNVDSQQSVARMYGVSAMPTFLIFRSGTIIKTIRGADPRGLESAIQEAVRLAGAAKPSYSSAGYTLGGGPSTQQQPSMARAWSWNLTKLWGAMITFIGLYFVSLFSLDGYAAAEKSPFNIHREPQVPTGRPLTGAKAPVSKERKIGTVQDITGDS